MDQRRREEPYSQRTIRVRVEMNREEARFTVADDGPGFDTSTMPDPEDDEAWQRVSGRGLLLIRTLMDEVSYNDAGNCVTLIKRRPAVEDLDLSEISLSD